MMSFPHRTAFYDREDEKIRTQGDVWEAVLHNDLGVVEPDRYGQWQKTNRYIPPASTGLEDSDGNEIFEGHVLENDRNEPFTYIIFWSNKYAFDAKWCRFHHEENKGGIRTDLCDVFKIVGHALTDPDLVPKGFDVEKYFNLEGGR